MQHMAAPIMSNAQQMTAQPQAQAQAQYQMPNMTAMKENGYYKRVNHFYDTYFLLFVYVELLSK